MGGSILGQSLCMSLGAHVNRIEQWLEKMTQIFQTQEMSQHPVDFSSTV